MKKLLLCLLSTILCLFVPECQAEEKIYDVIVVGAGISGLVAANQLQDHNYKVLVLEGSNRVGGRIWTDHSFGEIIELGAHWIQGIQNNPIAELAKKLKLEVLVTDTEKLIIYNSKGIILNQLGLDTLEKLGKLFAKALKYYQEELEQDVSLAVTASKFASREQLSKEDLKKFHYLTGSEIELEYAADLAQLSTLYYNQDEETLGDDVIFPKGYDQVPQQLAKPLDIRLNQYIKEINYQKNTIAVSSGDNTFYAQHVICTVPLGVLKKKVISFVPALPDEKLHAIDRLGMGTVDKTILFFDRVFWDKDKIMIGYIPVKGNKWMEFFNFYPLLKKPMLIAFNQGASALEMEAWPDEKIVASAMDTLKIIYGKDIPEPIHYKISRWGANKYSYGSYSHIPVGASGEDYDILARPVNNKLFFAGEATSRAHPSTVHGAYLSGLRAAKQIQELRNKQWLFIP